MAETQKFIGMAEDDFVQGGLLSDVDVEITALQLLGWDYQHAIDYDVLAVRAELSVLDEKGSRLEVAPEEQFWSCGPKFEEVIVSEDGYRLLPGSKSNLTKGSNWFIMLQSLWQYGMPKDYLREGNIKVLLGTKFHAVRVPAPKREGLASSGGKNPDREKTVLVANAIISAPWKKGTTRTRASSASTAPAAGAAAGAAGAAPAAAEDSAAANGAGDTTTLAGDLIRKILTDNPVVGSVADLKVLAFRELQSSAPDKRNSILGKLVTLMKDQGWLKDNGVTAGDAGIALS